MKRGALAPASPQPPQPSDVADWESLGTGFAINPSRVVTALHVVKGMSVVQVRFGSADWINAEVNKTSSSTDVAVLVPKVPVSTYLKMSRGLDTAQGDRVFTIGYPAVAILGREPKYTEGVVSSLSGLDNDDCMLQTSVAVQPGSSGGPLVREDGVVIGMVTSTAAVKNFLAVTGALPQNVNWAIKSRCERGG